MNIQKLLAELKDQNVTVLITFDQTRVVLVKGQLNYIEIPLGLPLFSVADEEGTHLQFPVSRIYQIEFHTRKGGGPFDQIRIVL